MQQVRLRGFAKTLLYNENQITGTLNALIQSIGIGGLKPNTMLLGWPTREIDKEDKPDSEYHTFTRIFFALIFFKVYFFNSKINFFKRNFMLVQLTVWLWL